jgi:cellobiose phosphorylase
MKKEKPAKSSAWWTFTGDGETFGAESPDQISRLYFPLCNDAGLLSAIAPGLQGDIKTGLNSFLTLPVSTEDLHAARVNRNFWVLVDGREPWSAAGLSANTASLRAQKKETCRVEAGILWHGVTRENKPLGLRAQITNFVPAGNDTVEVMRVTLTNTGRKPLSLSALAAIPIFGRSADNLRDHRHVTSLLHRIHLHRHGVLVQPTMSFDERGHRPNDLIYAVLGADETGEPPMGSYPTVASFLGEGGQFDAPKAVLEDRDIPELSDVEMQGREAMGALRFKSRKLAPGKSFTYVLLLGIAREARALEGWLRAYGSEPKAQQALDATAAAWKERLDRVQITTDDADYSRWVRWVSLQPILRKLFGNSFLPDFDYGRGGRGWRDLWQDCLALLLLDPGSVRESLLNNFGGVRRNGTNATIIGKKPGEFIADRNNISRVWMDHGVWPWITTEFYLHQTGDFDFLFEEAPYFGNREEGGRGSVLEHLIIQHTAMAQNLGAHGNCRLLDADWNDGLDMAHDRGESVAFTAVYAGNLRRIAELLRLLKQKKGLSTVTLQGKQQPVETVAEDLQAEGEKLARQVSDHEWIEAAGQAWFNGYYDNNGERVEGEFKTGVRMTLTGQVFPILSGVASDDQARRAYAAARRFLQDKKLGGFRLNTDFGDNPPPLGRAFAFAYGEKENGAFFSHMVVMFAFALYARGLVSEGHEVFSSLYRMATQAEVARIYPGMPEYFNGEGRGLYHYLTGSASWYMLTLVTQVLGIRGEWGDLRLAPKLMPEQFGASGQVRAQVYFAGKKLNVTYFNRGKKPYGKYRVDSLLVHGKSFATPNPAAAEVLIPRQTITQISSDTVDITLSLA